ncbi:MAG TPA: polysaccharide deacetylase [Peptococcaceae bacterium]|nr:polysaccharide deacetylase [Peptococcaceae bacterium]
MLVFFLISGFLVYQLVGSNMETSKVLSPIYQGDPARKYVAFTVNVDWGGEYLPQMLSLFEEHEIKGAFFLTGRWVSENPELTKKIAESGHEIGNHGYSHPHVNNLSLEENIEEIKKTSEIIYQLTGEKTRFFAPPYGEYNEVVLKAAEKTGHQTVMWTVDTLDWKNPPHEWIVSRVLARLHNGAIILMHPTAPTLKALPGIIAGIRDQGYQVKPLEILVSEASPPGGRWPLSGD